MLLATLLPDAQGMTDIYSRTTYGGGIIPRSKGTGGLALAAVLDDPDAPHNRDSYERAVILVTGGFAD